MTHSIAQRAISRETDQQKCCFEWAPHSLDLNRETFICGGIWRIMRTTITLKRLVSRRQQSQRNQGNSQRVMRSSSGQFCTMYAIWPPMPQSNSEHISETKWLLLRSYYGASYWDNLF